MSRDKISVIVIDDEQDALSRMKYILDKFPELQASGYFNHANEGIKAVIEARPDSTTYLADAETHL